MIYSAIVFLPLIGAMIAGLFGRVIGDRPSELITTGLMILAAVLSWFVFIETGFAHDAAKTAVKVPVLKLNPVSLPPPVATHSASANSARNAAKSVGGTELPRPRVTGSEMAFQDTSRSISPATDTLFE